MITAVEARRVKESTDFNPPIKRYYKKNKSIVGEIMESEKSTNEYNSEYGAYGERRLRKE